jgi:iron complex outermembrane receptor protein
VSAILGGSWEDEMVGPLDRLRASLNLSLVERLPSESERFAFWRNPGIQRFLIGGDLDGDPLETERSMGLDLGFEAEVEEVSLSLNLFHYQIDGFIFLQDLVGIGNQAGYTQRDARFYGFEAQADYPLWESGERELLLSLMADGMRASERGSGAPLPRIPPLRLGTRLQWDQSSYQAGLEVRYAFAQERVQKSTGVVQGELPTDGYTEINLDFSYDWQLPRNTTLTLFAQLRNLLDEDRRLHTSFVKDVAPLPGRNLTVGGRLSF